MLTKVGIALKQNLTTGMTPIGSYLVTRTFKELGSNTKFSHLAMTKFSHRSMNKIDQAQCPASL